jgi:hypothetical protein
LETIKVNLALMVLLPMTFEARLQNYCNKRKNLIINKRTSLAPKEHHYHLLVTGEKN